MNTQLDFYEDIIVFLNKKGLIQEANEEYLKIFDTNLNSIKNKEENEFLKLIFSTQNEINYEKLFLDENCIISDEVIELNGEKKHFRTKKENLDSMIKITRRDVTEFKQYLSLYNSHIYLLELIAKAKPLEFILNEIIKTVEQKNSNMICSILLYNEKDNKLYKGAAPSLPEYYNEKLNGMLIGEKVGSCGAAAYLKQRIIVDDISTHENWKYAKNLAAKFDLRACWSQPIISSSKEILGTFAIYYKKPKSPSNFDVDLIEDIASVAGVAIEKHMKNEELKKEIEENKKQEELLMLRSKQAMLGEMFESIAHQWRQPLSVISLYATGILYKKNQGADTTELDKEAFNVIGTNAQYLSDTITNFRSYFTSNSEKVHFTLNEAIEYSLKLFEGRMKAEDITIVHALEDIELYNYRNELTQVFINLFNNSADVLKTIGYEDRIISIKSKIKNDYIRIDIIDSGKGADEKVIEKLFDPYFTTKDESSGTGLGLYMSHDIIVKHMTGKISAKNDTFIYKDKEYIGLKFSIELPIDKDRVVLDYVIWGLNKNII